MINDSILESDEEENEEENENKRGRPLAKLCILKNQHIPEAGECFNAAIITHVGCLFMPDSFFSVTQSCPFFWEKIYWVVTPTPAPCPCQQPQYPNSMLPSASLSTGGEVVTVKWT